MTWHLLTGGYPPQSGGVSDYSRSVALGLAAVGDEVHVWAPRCVHELENGNVRIHRLPDCFGPVSLSLLDCGLRRKPGRVLVQYVPQAFGYKGLNLPFVTWLRLRARPLDVMFHEVAFPIARGQPWRHNVLGRVHRGMARLLVAAADRIFVSVPAWGELLRRLAPRCPEPIWCPVPSNLPTRCDRDVVAAVRQRIAPDAGTCLVGHFGTYGELITQLLKPALAELLRSQQRIGALLIGRGSAEFAHALCIDHPDVANRVWAAGPLEAPQAAAHLAACDVLLQPYPDGISSRRTSAMAGLALGRPIVTNVGSQTEPIWQESAAVVLANSDCLPAEIERLLSNEQRCTDLGRRADMLYRDRFDLKHTIERLRAPTANLAALAT